ncbi:MAG: hypothetical protein AAGB34_07340 [Planctomycetota bacterium]
MNDIRDAFENELGKPITARFDELRTSRIDRAVARYDAWLATKSMISLTVPGRDCTVTLTRDPATNTWSGRAVLAERSLHEEVSAELLPEAMQRIAVLSVDVSVPLTEQDIRSGARGSFDLFLWFEEAYSDIKLSPDTVAGQFSWKPKGTLIVEKIPSDRVELVIE